MYLCSEAFLQQLNQVKVAKHIDTYMASSCITSLSSKQTLPGVSCLLCLRLIRRAPIVPKIYVVAYSNMDCSNAGNKLSCIAERDYSSHSNMLILQTPYNVAWYEMAQYNSPWHLCLSCHGISVLENLIRHELVMILHNYI